MTLATALCLALSTSTVAPPAIQIDLPSSEIRLRDLVLSGERGDLVVGQVPKGSATLLLTLDDQMRLIRNRLPGHAKPLKFPAGVLIRVLTAKAAPRSFGNACYQTRAAVPAGSYLNRSDAVAAQCTPDLDTANLSFDRNARAPFTASDLAAFSYLGNVLLPEIEPIRAGTKMTLRTVSGPVTIDQSVITLQPGRPGKRTFVQTDGGKVISEKLSSEQSAEQAR